jgi:phosphatidylinositol glycan class U
MKIAESGEAGSSKFFTSPRKDKKWGSFSIAAA